ncbi:Protein S-acyltransferase 10, partial [Cucurbita argyrosperma subsp. argyrosperma]
FKSHFLFFDGNFGVNCDKTLRPKRRCKIPPFLHGLKMIMDACHHRDFSDRIMDRYIRFFPCLSDPARRSSLGLKVALVMLHLVYAGVLFALDRHLIEEIKIKPWYTASYLLLFVATLIQYFLTSCSSPGYVLDAMRAANEKDIAFSKASK